MLYYRVCSLLTCISCIRICTAIIERKLDSSELIALAHLPRRTINLFLRSRSVTKSIPASIDEFYRQNLSFSSNNQKTKCSLSMSTFCVIRGGNQFLRAFSKFAESSNILEFSFENFNSVNRSLEFLSTSLHSVFSVNDLVRSSLYLSKYSADNIWSTMVELSVDDTVYSFLHIVEGPNSVLMSRTEKGQIVCCYDTTTRSQSDWHLIIKKGKANLKHLAFFN